MDSSAALRRRLEVLQIHLRQLDSGSEHSSQCSLQPCQAALADGGVVLVGGMVMDLQAVPIGAADIQRGGSVPGKVSQSAGGVARNVAESLAQLLKSSSSGQLPLLVSAVGSDLAGQALLQHWRSLGLSTAGISVVPAAATPVVSVVFDKAGEVAACVADVALVEAALTPALFLTPTVAASLAGAALLMLDGNLSADALQAACQAGSSSSDNSSSDNSSSNSSSIFSSSGTTTRRSSSGCDQQRRRRRIWFEPVSVPKAVRAAALLRSLDFISPNAAELVAMAEAARQQLGQRHCSAAAQPASCGDRSALPAARGPATRAAVPRGSAESMVRQLLPHVSVLLEAGVGHIVLTLGQAGAALCRLLGQDSGQVLVTHVPALPASVVNCSGAGDCLVAGCLYALAQGKSAEQALSYGVAAAKAAVESLANVPPGLGATALERSAAEAASRATTFTLPASCGCLRCVST